MRILMVGPPQPTYHHPYSAELERLVSKAIWTRRRGDPFGAAAVVGPFGRPRCKRPAASGPTS
jgi:hypothetical protein